MEDETWESLFVNCHRVDRGLAEIHKRDLSTFIMDWNSAEIDEAEKFAVT